MRASTFFFAFVAIFAMAFTVSAHLDPIKVAPRALKQATRQQIIERSALKAAADRGLAARHKPSAVPNNGSDIAAEVAQLWKDIEALIKDIEKLHGTLDADSKYKKSLYTKKYNALKSAGAFTEKDVPSQVRAVIA